MLLKREWEAGNGKGEWGEGNRKWEMSKKNEKKGQQNQPEL